MIAEIGKIVVFLGLLLVAVGFILTLFPSVGFGRLPGDFIVQKKNWSIYIPVTTSIVLSAILSLLFWIIISFRR